MQCKDFINNFQTLYLTLLKISKLEIKNIEIEMEHNIDYHDQIQAIGIQGK